MTLSEHSDRERHVYALLCGLTIILGLASRSYRHFLPGFMAEYAGDTLWATMVFLGLAVMLPKKSTAALATTALAISFLVEFSQLYHATWIDSIRHTRLGALALGEGFLWSDLLCYTAGVCLALLIDLAVCRAKTHPVPKV